jgi:hypothetical protein
MRLLLCVSTLLLAMHDAALYEVLHSCCCKHIAQLCVWCSVRAVDNALQLSYVVLCCSSLTAVSLYTCCFQQAYSLHALLTHRHITPAQDRSQPLVLNLCLALPAGFRSVTLSAQFSKMFLTVAEYPPDAHRGFDVPAAKITFGVTDLHGNWQGQHGSSASSSSSLSWHVCTASRAEQQQQQQHQQKVQQLPLLQALAAACCLQVR